MAWDAPLDPMGYIGWAASPSSVDRPNVHRGTGSRSTMGKRKVPGAERMIAGTSSDPNVQFSNVGRKSASSPARFQSSVAPSSDSGRRSSATKLNALPAVGKVGDRVAHELLVPVAGPDHRATVEHRLDLGDPTPEQRAAPPRSTLGPDTRCGVRALWMPSAVTTASPATTSSSAAGCLVEHCARVVGVGIHRQQTVAEVGARWPTRASNASSSTSCSTPRWTESCGHG